MLRIKDQDAMQVEPAAEDAAKISHGYADSKSKMDDLLKALGEEASEDDDEFEDSEAEELSEDDGDEEEEDNDREEEILVYDGSEELTL